MECEIARRSPDTILKSNISVFVVRVPGTIKICALRSLGNGNPKMRLLIQSQCETPHHKAGFSQDLSSPLLC